MKRLSKQGQSWFENIYNIVMSEIGQPQPSEVVQQNLNTSEQNVDIKTATPFTQRIQDFFNRFKTAEVQGISKPVEQISIPEPTHNTSKSKENKKKLITRRTIMQLMGATALSPLLGKAHFGPEMIPFPNEDTARLEIPTANPEAVIKELFGVDPKEYGMESMLQIPSTNGKYFVHIGQRHSVDDYYADMENTNQETSQLNIERFLTDAKIKTAYLELESEETIKFLYEIRDIQQNQISKIPNNYQGLKELHRLNISQVNKIGIEYGQGIDHWGYVVSIKLEEIKKSLEDKPELFTAIPDQDEAKLAQALGKTYKPQTTEEIIADIGVILKLYEGESINTRIGTGAKMYFDGKLQIYPTETEKENEEGYTASIDLIELQRDLTNASTQEDKDKILAKIEEAKSVVYKETMGDREKVAIDLVTASPPFKDAKISTIIYGAAHDFSEEVMRANQTNPSEQRGLIYLAPKSMIAE